MNTSGIFLVGVVALAAPFASGEVILSFKNGVRHLGKIPEGNYMFVDCQNKPYSLVGGKVTATTDKCEPDQTIRLGASDKGAPLEVVSPLTVVSTDSSSGVITVRYQEKDIPVVWGTGSYLGGLKPKNYPSVKEGDSIAVITSSFDKEKGMFAFTIIPADEAKEAKDANKAKDPEGGGSPYK